jgi:2-amino-1-hydroxyethylphosphonate dioxygenase (glycine-forming)
MMCMNEQGVRAIVSEVINLYENYGDGDYIGEPVSQLEHMCQCAEIAESEGYDEEIILAAFFHDIGHFCEHLTDVKQMGGLGVVDHEKLGADFLRQHGFSETIASLVQNHVQAKRYLTCKSPAYYDKLSKASKKTLEFQGGKMTEEEARNFEADQLFELHIRLRTWDERAKESDIPLPPLDKYRQMMFRHLMKSN